MWARLASHGIRFAVYSNDHLPRHVHAFLGDTEVVVDLLADSNVGLASRFDAIRPANARRADVRKILNVACRTL